MPTDVSGDLMQIVLLLGLALIVVSCVWLAFLPGKIARRRNHPSQDAIRLCGVVGLFIWPAWFVALVWAHSKPKLSAGRDAGATPFAQRPSEIPRAAEDEWGDLPGSFDVAGVDRDSGLDTHVVIEAESPANARVKAELRGIVVTGVRRVL